MSALNQLHVGGGGGTSGSAAPDFLSRRLHAPVTSRAIVRAADSAREARFRALAGMKCVPEFGPGSHRPHVTVAIAVVKKR